MKKNALNSKEIALILGVSQPTASRYIKKMNSELEAEGYYAVTGKVPIPLFQEKFPYFQIPEELLEVF
ncbi:hypothetical protein BU098_12385 [Staphylococcus xylosus]|nr:hypothetical protein BU098_12385 [Staphylococcus xylosus]